MTQSKSKNKVFLSISQIYEFTFINVYIIKGPVNVCPKSIFRKVLLEVEKIVKTFSIPNKLFPKLYNLISDLLDKYTYKSI